jgi:hypothetical protein
MKRILGLILVVAFMVSVVACKGGGPAEQPAEGTTPTKTT